jgi:hypothetical protein
MSSGSPASPFFPASPVPAGGILVGREEECDAIAVALTEAASPIFRSS